MSEVKDRLDMNVPLDALRFLKALADKAELNGEMSTARIVAVGTLGKLVEEVNRADSEEDSGDAES